MRLLSSLLAFTSLVSAGPVDFGLAELNAAIAERKLRSKNLVELSLDAPETFRIEPYKVGGAHITGGDLRGLMYGLLEAAEQIRATGRFAKVTGSPAASLRGVRVSLDAELEQAPREFWHAYFRMLARNRFNRVHMVFQRIAAPYRLPQFLSRTAADYGIDFTLGVAGVLGSKELAQALMVCPAIRGVAPESVATQETVFSALRVAGRRLTLDLDGAAPSPGVAEAAAANDISLLRAASAWPPSFEIAPPLETANPDAHSLFYSVLGRLSYDPKAKPPKEADPAEYNAAREIALWIAAAQQSNLGGSDYVASAAETARNRQEHIASAKFTPGDIAERLYIAAGRLTATTISDLQLVAAMARQQADQQIAAADFPPLAKAAPSSWTHTPPASAPSERPLTVTLRIAQPKTVSAVRLHYRPVDPAAQAKTLELPASAEVSFTIPAADITGNWDLLYFFEILHAEGNGWFEPDPLTATPYRVVHVIAPHTGRN